VNRISHVYVFVLFFLPIPRYFKKPANHGARTLLSTGFMSFITYRTDTSFRRNVSDMFGVEKNSSSSEFQVSFAKKVRTALP